MSYESEVAADSPVGFWPLETDADDASGNGHDGVIVGALDFDGVAATFDGSSYVNVDAAVGDLLGDDLTIEAWVTPVTGGSGVVMAGNDASDYNRAAIRHSGGSWTLEDQASDVTTGSWSADVEYHVALTVDESSRAYVFYVNGSSVSSGTFTGDQVFRGASDRLSIGQEWDSPSAASEFLALGTRVRRAAVYGSALSGARVSAHYSAGTTPGNVPPTADAGPDQSVVEGVTVNLDSSGSSDVEDSYGSLTHAWTVFDADGTGMVTGDLSDAATDSPSFTAPSVSISGAQIVLQVRVEDTDGGIDTDLVVVTVSDAAVAASVWPTDPLPMAIELLIDNAWVDVTSYARAEAGVVISRGITGSDNSIDPGSCELTLDNRDGRFSPRNPDGPYFGKIGRNTQLRVVVAYGGVIYPRFRGEVAEWPVDWDKTGRDVWAPIRADGPLRRLGQSTGESESLLTGAIPVILQDELLAYWPMEDLKGATSLASRGPRARPMRKHGTGFLADDDSFPASKPLPRVTNGEYRGMIPNQAETGAVQALFLVHIQESAEPNPGRQSIVQLHVTGDDMKRMSLYYRDDVTGGGFGLECHDEDGNQLDDTATVDFDGVEGRRFLVGMAALEHSGHVDAIIDVVDCDTGVTDWIVDEWSGVSDVGRCWKVNTNNNGGLDDTTIGHLMVLNSYTDPTASGGAGAELRDAATAFVGETAVNRLSRIASERNMAFSFGSEPDINSAALGAQLPTDAVEQLQEAVDADMGLLYERRDALGFRYIERAALYNATSELELVYTDQVFAETPIPVDDDALLTNEVEVQRQQASSYVAARADGPLVAEEIGDYRSSVTLNLRDEGLLAPSAGWLLNLGTVDRARFPELVVRTERDQIASDSTLLGEVLSVDVGSMVTLSDLPAWMPPDDARVFVYGISEDLWNFGHRLTINTRPADGWDVGDYDAAAHRYDSHPQVVIGEDLDTTETTVTVECGEGPFFTTAGGDVPFDVDIGGERMTVTSVASPSGSTQNLTVTRSVNGVVKSHDQDDAVAVRLWQPRRWAS